MCILSFQAATTLLPDTLPVVMLAISDGCTLFDHAITLCFQMRAQGAFKVCLDTYVTEESGTGVVHQAPYFGEVTLIHKKVRACVA